MSSFEQLASACSGDSAPATLERLREIWCEVLEIQSVRDGDNFIDLGGDSIAATLCLNQIKAVLGVTLPIVRLFEERMTLASLAHDIDHLRNQHETDAPAL